MTTNTYPSPEDCCFGCGDPLDDTITYAHGRAFAALKDEVCYCQVCSCDPILEELLGTHPNSF